MSKFDFDKCHRHEIEWDKTFSEEDHKVSLLVKSVAYIMMLWRQNFSFRRTVDTRPFLNGPGNEAIRNCTRGGAWKWGLPFLHEIAVPFLSPPAPPPPSIMTAWHAIRTWASECLRVNSGSNFWMGREQGYLQLYLTWKWGLLSHAEKDSCCIHNAINPFLCTSDA